MAGAQAQQFIDALHRLEERHDLNGMVALFGDDAEVRNPTDSSAHQGVDGARHFWDAYRRSFEEIHSEFRSVVENDGVVMLEWTSRGRAAKGAPVEYDGVSVVEYRDGKVQRFRAYFDPSALQA
ncbi:MAG: nuclear transport factor 2 family protein [Gemmatimonadota bacterium]